MKNLKSIEKSLSRHRDELRRKFGVIQLAVFGSYAESKPRKRSDLDILVEFEQGHKTFDNYMDLKFFLENLLSIRVDLVLKSALKEELKERILDQAIYV